MKAHAKFMERLGWGIFRALCRRNSPSSWSPPRTVRRPISSIRTGKAILNNGILAGSAWQTCAKVERRELPTRRPSPLFKRGGEWHEQLAASSSGAAGNPITYDAYGSGANPKFWGSDVLNPANWQSLGNNVYAYPGMTAANVTEVLANHGTETNGQCVEAENEAHEIRRHRLRRRQRPVHRQDSEGNLGERLGLPAKRQRSEQRDDDDRVATQAATSTPRR